MVPLRILLDSLHLSSKYQRLAEIIKASNIGLFHQYRVRLTTTTERRGYLPVGLKCGWESALSPILPPLNTWDALANNTLLSLTKDLRKGRTSDTFESHSKMGINWYSSVQDRLSYQEIVGIAHSGWNMYEEGLLSIIIVSFSGRSIRDRSLTYTPLWKVQCSLNSLYSQRPFGSNQSSRGFAYFESEAV